MEWNEKLQVIIDEIEERLQQKEEPIDIDKITALAGCSYSFFMKVFSYMFGFSFSEYIRFRKLTLAGYDIKSTEIKIVDLSFKYGYDSPTSFTKAFQKFHGVSPKEARKQKIELRVFPKLQCSAVQNHAWRLEKKQAVRLIGKQHLLPQNPSEIDIPAFWSSCQRDGTFLQLVNLDQGNPKGILGVFDERKEERVYSLMVKSDAELPEGFYELILPEETWAVFDCKGSVPEAIQKGWAYLQGEWLCRYPFRHAFCPEIEWYSDGNPYDKEYLSQIWIPVIEENE